MDLTSIRYFLVLAKTLHFTKAAQTLFITQQNLSQHIKKLESYLGTPLFYRKPQLALTPAGEAFFKSAQTLIATEDDIFRRINDMSENNVGALHIGINQYRGQFWVPSVLPLFMQQWPNVSISLAAETSKKMELMLLSGELDFYVGIKHGKDDVLNSIPLMRDKIYLAVPKNLLLQHFGEASDTIIEECQNGTTLERFSDFPFILLSSNYQLRNQLDIIFSDAGFAPKIVLEACSIEMTASLLNHEIGALFCTEMKLPSLKADYSDALFFPILFNNSFVSSPVCLVYHKDRYLPKYALDFIERVKNYFSSFT